MGSSSLVSGILVLKCMCVNVKVIHVTVCGVQKQITLRGQLTDKNILTKFTTMCRHAKTKIHSHALAKKTHSHTHS